MLLSVIVVLLSIGALFQNMRLRGLEKDYDMLEDEIVRLWLKNFQDNLPEPEIEYTWPLLGP